MCLKNGQVELYWTIFVGVVKNLFILLEKQTKKDMYKSYKKYRQVAIDFL